MTLVRSITHPDWLIRSEQVRAFTCTRLSICVTACDHEWRSWFLQWEKVKPAGKQVDERNAFTYSFHSVFIYRSRTSYFPSRRHTFFSCDRINLTGGEVQRLNVMSLILIQPPLASVSYSHVLYVYNWVDAPQKGINNIIYMLLSTFATIKRDLLAGKALQKLIKAKSCFSFPKTSDGEPCALLIIIITLPKLWPLNSVKWKFWHSARKPCQVTWQTKSFWWMLCEDDLCSTASIIPQVTLQVHH